MPDKRIKPFFSGDFFSWIQKQPSIKVLNTQPRCAVFTHSLERNGANNFTLYLVQQLLQQMQDDRHQEFVIYAPGEGPMRSDFEELGLEVRVLNPKASDFQEKLFCELDGEGYGLVIANTIMKCDVVITAGEKLKIPTLWVIHEAWPQDQFEYYAKEVFQMAHIDSNLIKKAFGCQNVTVMFPSEEQKKLYCGLFRENKAFTVYNGIPLEPLDSYLATTDRDAVRERLGYSQEDIVLLHLGTICHRKGQLYSTKALSRLVNDYKLNVKLLMVGARYIRDHEIAYIKTVEQTATDSGVRDRLQILDIQKDVRPYLLAADLALVPSLNEVLPLVVCEAMACKVPVIASRIDAIPEAVTDGVEGRLVPAEDDAALAKAAVDILSLSAEERIKMGEAGRARVLTQFSLQAMGNRYREILDQVVVRGVLARRLSEEAKADDSTNIPGSVQIKKVQIDAAG